MTIQASSVWSDLTRELYTLLDEESSFARKYVSDSSNTNAVPFKTAMKALLRSVSALHGLAASTAELNIMDGVTASSSELNKVDGIAGHAVAYASSARLVAATKRSVTGSTNIGMASLGLAGKPGGVAPLIFTQLAAGTNPGANYAFARSSYVVGAPSTGAGTVLVKVYKPTDATTTTPIPSGAAIVLDIWVFGT